MDSKKKRWHVSSKIFFFFIALVYRLPNRPKIPPEKNCHFNKFLKQTVNALVTVVKKMEN